MFNPRRITSVIVLCVALLVTTVAPRASYAGVSDTALALAAPLAEQFGVPVSAVKGLLQDGISLETVTQLLLVARSAKKGLDTVTQLYRASNDIAATASKLNVAASEYSPDKVTAALDAAKTKMQADATEKATEKATDAVNDAVGSALGGFRR